MKENIMRELETEFDNEMLKIYNAAQVQCNYRPVRFMQMLFDFRGVETAKKIINKDSELYSFSKLCECGREDLTVEALVLKDEYKDLFTEEEREICRQRLNSVKR